MNCTNILDIIKDKGLLLAPMAGVTDLAFRETVHEISPEVIVFSEMISAKAMSYNDKHTFDLLKTSEKDCPLSVQIFGHEPEVMAEAAKKIEALGFLNIDINFGCPAPKIVKNGDGSALMKNPALVFDIISNVKTAGNLTVSAKFRLGFDQDHITVIECSKLAEEAGADFITIHGRTRDMQYAGQADLSYIKEVKKLVKIPVIGNGDVTDYSSCNTMFKKTNCDGVMVGRGALGNPFIFECLKNPDKKITKFDKMNLLMRQISKMCAYKRNAIKESRMHILWYLKGLHNAKFYKEKASKVLVFKDVENLITEITENNSVY